MRKASGIIPVRYKSSRYPGKPLARILGKPMIQMIYENIKEAKLLDRVLIATDDEKIFEAAVSFGAEVLMTSDRHESGTDRIAEVAEKINTPIIINIQGDEPLVNGEMVDELVSILQDETIPMATYFFRNEDLDLLKDRNSVKMVCDKEGYALYFSRSPIPFNASDYFFQHIGMYGYQKQFLIRLVKLNPSRLEKVENLEQLRALEYGYKIKSMESSFRTIGVDTPEDLVRVENFIKKNKDD